MLHYPLLHLARAEVLEAKPRLTGLSKDLVVDLNSMCCFLRLPLFCGVQGKTKGQLHIHVCLFVCLFVCLLVCLFVCFCLFFFFGGGLKKTTSLNKNTL